jgi:hypothetical protein
MLLCLPPFFFCKGHAESQRLIRDFSASRSYEDDVRVLRSMVKCQHLYFSFGRRKRDDLFVFDSVEGKMALFLAHDLAMEACEEGSTLLITHVSSLEEIVRDYKTCAIVYDVKGHSVSYVEVDEKRIKEMQ